VPGDCVDGVDNDSNGLVDLEDPQCRNCGAYGSNGQDPDPLHADDPEYSERRSIGTVFTTGPSMGLSTLDGSPYETALAGLDEEQAIENALALTLREKPGTFYLATHLGSMVAGENVRAVWSYDSCPEGKSVGDDITIANNFDLAICGRYNDGVDDVWECLWVSESPHETNEGFHVTTPRDYDEVDILRLFPGSATKCPDEHGNLVHEENARLEIVTWP
jgi:hypothetical protein